MVFVACAGEPCGLVRGLRHHGRRGRLLDHQKLLGLRVSTVWFRACGFSPADLTPEEKYYSNPGGKPFYRNIWPFLETDHDSNTSS